MRTRSNCFNPLTSQSHRPLEKIAAAIAPRTLKSAYLHFTSLYLKIRKKVSSSPNMKSVLSISVLGVLLGVTELCWAFQSLVPQRTDRNAAVSSSILMASVADDAVVAKSSITTGPEGRAALNFEEDLLLTLQIIMDHERRSATVSKEQFVQQVAAAAALEKDEVVIDVSVPYDAAARLAYAKEGSTVPFEEFKDQYEAKAVAEVRAKKSGEVVDISVPYDAAARLAYAKEGSTVPFEEFKDQYEAKAVAEVRAKKSAPESKTGDVTVSIKKEGPPSSSYDVAVPYDAAAQLAYSRLGSIKHKLSYDKFKVQYENNAVTNVIMKKNKRTNIE